MIATDRPTLADCRSAISCPAAHCWTRARGAGGLLAALLAWGLAGCTPNPLGPPPPQAACTEAPPRLIPLEPVLAALPSDTTGGPQVENALLTRAAALRARGDALRSRDD